VNAPYQYSIDGMKFFQEHFSRVGCLGVCNNSKNVTGFSKTESVEMEAKLTLLFQQNQ